ncbi:riboflavin synthase [Liquorilactobacillus capillatus]|uniref:Riboflavin synthase n=1 Tax=Liquorilactobacillus capillatus DSM 19910 TaxID=1423731 RepID=A0A0R1M326_9LACO|nr:riboflavin synthase [Liquorilactobacillus capillatus]KRL02428.1 riboflavin synthase subunit alpha [Liquorilactobacillus capillatus DSM 19910]
MFTGIIEDIGIVQNITRKQEIIFLSIMAPKIKLEDSQIGASIAVDGVCLTVTARTASVFTANIMPETFRITSLARLKRGDKVNLERAVAVGGRFDGHFVLGHVDRTTSILRRYQDQTAQVLVFKIPVGLETQIVTKGSVAIDGISLTVIYADSRTFKVGLIPHSQQVTTLSNKTVGAYVNLETDVLAKYSVKQMRANQF